MDISVLNGLSGIGTTSNATQAVKSTNNNESFENLFKSALSMINETNDLSNAAEDAEMSYALGYNENTHDLQVAQQKANLSLEYTVAVRNKVLEAYKEIMNFQF
jgi:flagellar hook-basal body complex protein FliE